MVIRSYTCFFFFSSRRRHTRCSRDWSSDVCSSDLAPAVAGLTRRAALLLEDRATISLGVARNQLVIEGVATHPKHPVLRELAGRLHPHHLGAITFPRGVEPAEVGDAPPTPPIQAQ